MTKGSLIDYDHLSSSSSDSWSCTSDDQELCESSASKGTRHYLYISSPFWNCTLNSIYAFFGSPEFDIDAQYSSSGSSWSTYSSGTIKNSSATFSSYSPTGSHMYRFRYEFMGGTYAEGMYGSATCYGFGRNSSKYSFFKGEILRKLRYDYSFTIYAGKSESNQTPVNTYRYTTTSSEGVLVTSSDDWRLCRYKCS